MKCAKCGENRFYFKDWQDERDNINHICVYCNQQYTPEKETKVNQITAMQPEKYKYN